jgi:hypothetical protein
VLKAKNKNGVIKVGLKQRCESQWWVITINIVLILALILFIGRQCLSDIQKIFQAKIALNFSALLKALSLYGCNFSLFVVAWHSIVVRLGGPADWGQNLFIYSYTNLTKFLPTPFWFLASRVHFYNQSGVKHKVALAMTIMEILLHILTGIVFYTLIAISPKCPITLLYIPALILVFIVLLRPRWLELLHINKDGIELRVRRKDIILWFSLYLLTWVIAGPFLSAVINVFNIEAPPLIDLWRIWTLASLVSYIATYILGGIGILREITLAWLLSRFYSPAMALLIAVGARLILIIGGILYGLIVSRLLFILLRKANRRAEDA